MGPSVVFVARDIWHESQDKGVGVMWELDKIQAQYVGYS